MSHSDTHTHDMQVAQTILEQLGGSKFLTMTGARGSLALPNGLTFMLPRGFAKDRINRVNVTLTPDDLYDMEFVRIGNAPTYRTTQVAKHTGVYADQLQHIFTEVTGLDTHL